MGRIRGATFTTAGLFEVSADADSDNDGNPGPVATLFGNHSPDNAADFAAFSPERIFGLVGANQLDVRFSVPGTPAAAGLVRGFGVVFTDVETAGSTGLEFFDVNDQLIGSALAPAFGDGSSDTFKSFSFVGVTFIDAVIARVRITNGDVDLDVGDTFDAVAMDDFIYGEPAPVPVPAPLILLGSALLPLARTLRRRARC
ncbi:MAG: hypothetical protein ACREQB_00480 [Candidatus Binataceae bacterium]